MENPVLRLLRLMGAVPCKTDAAGRDVYFFGGQGRMISDSLELKRYEIREGFSQLLIILMLPSLTFFDEWWWLAFTFCVFALDYIQRKVLISRLKKSELMLTNLERAQRQAGLPASIAYSSFCSLVLLVWIASGGLGLGSEAYYLEGGGAFILVWYFAYDAVCRFDYLRKTSSEFNSKEGVRKFWLKTFGQTLVILIILTLYAIIMYRHLIFWVFFPIIVF